MKDLQIDKRHAGQVASTLGLGVPIFCVTIQSPAYVCAFLLLRVPPDINLASSLRHHFDVPTISQDALK